jgi:hypothetical protein
MWSPLRRRVDGEPADGRPRPSERLRIPQPLIKRRLPSGRGATEQPNVTSDGDPALTPAFWVVLVATGLAAGLIGAGLMYLLFSVSISRSGTAPATLNRAPGTPRICAGSRRSSSGE